ncbi:LpqB family beta-propeller domain-containing protein [Microbacterium sp. STN6]|uniref:LpqB family beta-propeller domain-containing protein n=1 Tax=Microbacterium sp. STN6 TaxID=2995588 RepID=UPI002260EC68|nr:LpqB family beta-propeller domain-containing protein [Microbacterium sp. STN6]MCX7521087.1 LpqB family beta-propeller domain-containing protein [Microbacterium sp. STN6]
MKQRMRLAALALAVAATLPVAGCASIPRSGPVKVGGTIGDTSQDFTLDYIPEDPVKGASAGEILRGFVEASSSPQGDYEIARKYLTPKLASTWNADESVTVDEGPGRVYQELAANAWQLAVSPVADVDATGAYREVDAQTPVTLRYQLAKNAKGQWRISSAPNGVVIDLPTFRTVFSSRALYFYDPSFSFLVPDLRWFPARVSTPTRVVKALLAGPSKWLGQGALATAFPQGTQLAVDSVPAPAGRAEVDLNDAANSADQVTLARMKYQLQRSLLDGVSVGSVQMLIDGTPQQGVPELSGPNLPVSDPSIDPRPLVLHEGVFGFASGTTVSAIQGLSDKVEALAPTAAVISASQQSAAVLSAGGVSLVRTGASAATRIDERAGLIAPSLDPNGFVWSVPRTQPGAILATQPGGKQAAVEAGWTGATNIVSLQVSRDGTRVIAVLRSGANTKLVAASIIRDADGAPARLGPPLDLGSDGGSIVSAAWLDQLTVASLSTNANGETTVTTQQIGGQSQSVSGPVKGASIVGGSGNPTYWVLTSQGSLQAASGTGWQERLSKVALIATQQGAPH